MAKRIIDVSEHQKKIDWEKAKSDIDGCIIRIGYGDDDISQDDDYVKYNLDECERLKIPHEVYLYSYADTDKHIQSEIAHIKRLLAGRDIKRVWLDLEYRPAQKFWRKAAEAFLKAFPGGGVYSWEWVFTDILVGVECPRWICAYGPNNGKPDYDYKPHLECHGWQYTSKAKIAGITGGVDVSEWYGDFAEVPTQPATGSAAGRSDIVARMLAWENWSEQNGKFKTIIDIYNRYLPTAVKTGTVNYTVKYSDEWCATAASAAYIACGIGHLFPVECSCPRMVTLAQKMGIWQEADGYVPDIADAVLYDWQDSGSGDNVGIPDHIGIVISVDEKAGTFAVMEGNNGEAVARRTMKVNGRYIRGFICPEYPEGESQKAETPKEEPKPAEKKEETPKVKTGVYEVSGTGTPSKAVQKTGLLKNGQKVTARRQPISGAPPCSFSPVEGLTRIDVCDTITDKGGVAWDYCRIGGKYGFILHKSILSYLRVGGLPIQTVAKQVIDGDFGNSPTRSNALKALGYDAQKVQDKVNEILNADKKPPDTGNRIRIHAVWFFEKNEAEYGDCTAIYQFAEDGKKVEHCVLVDTAKATAAPVVIAKLREQGVKKIDAVIISHGHGDHYGGLDAICKAFPVERVFIPDCTELDKYQKTHGDALRRQAKKAVGTVMKTGVAYRVGGIEWKCIYQCKAKDLTDKGDHYFVNNQSAVLRFTTNGWVHHMAGDLQNEGNNLLVAAVDDLEADSLKIQWHGDPNANNEALCKAVRPLVAFSNYHHMERSGRGTTRKRLEAVGATVARNAENGDIYIDCVPGKMTLTCSKGNLTKTWLKAPEYKVCLTKKAKPVKGSGFCVIEPEDYTAAEIGELKAAGYRVLGYLSVGSVSDERSYFKKLEPYTLRRLDDWPHERYLDVCAETVQKWAVKRGKEIIAQGCDGLWIDNLDVCEEYPSDNAYKAITKILQTLYAHGYIMVNGGIAYMSKAMQRGDVVANGIMQEEVFSKITDYSGKGKFGAQEAEESTRYQKYIALALSKGLDACLLEYATDAAVIKKIIEYCKASGAGCYISDDVNL